MSLQHRSAWVGINRNQTLSVGWRAWHGDQKCPRSILRRLVSSDVHGAIGRRRSRFREAAPDKTPRGTGRSMFSDLESLARSSRTHSFLSISCCFTHLDEMRDRLSPNRAPLLSLLALHRLLMIY